ncbi:MAG: hypothetical protein WCP45_01700 [Verrucomicrobiota bacterium]
MKASPKFLAVGVTLALSYALGMPCQACPNGRCVRIGSMGTMNFKPTAASRLPVVTSVSTDSITVGDKKYLASTYVDVTVDGKEATLAAIKPGMRVLVTNEVTDKKKSLYTATRIVARTPEATAKKDKPSDTKSLASVKK